MMKQTKSSSESVYRSVADLFSGLMIALLLILVVIWLEALQEAIQIRRPQKKPRSG